MWTKEYDFSRHLSSQEGVDTISENGQIQDVNILIKKALDVSITSSKNLIDLPDFTEV